MIIKFLAWDSNLKIMINPYCELKDGNFWGEDCTNTGYCVKHEHVMQFIGQQDINGVDIYRGYILQSQITKTKYVVKFVGAAFKAFKADENIKNYPVALCKHDIILYHLKVIGNIYEHPELIS